MKINLFKNTSECCGCEACLNACPKNAVSMYTSREGFIYPRIDENLCIKCGICTKTCGYKQLSGAEIPRKVYAAAARSDSILKNTSSGGIFTLLAREVLRRKGIVFGSAFGKRDGNLCAYHMKADNLKDLKKMQGSKYVQSYIGNTYKEAKECLEKGTFVLFSGTPCQIAGLNSFLNKQYKNLITVDIICHGVPSAKMFSDFIKYYEKKNNVTITDFCFRDKSRGQGMTNRIEYIDSGNKKSQKVICGELNSYMGLFLKSLNYRDNCYSCPFAQNKRVSDITLGDYWGVYQEHSKELAKMPMSNSKGISCVLLNTEKGIKLFDDIKQNIFTIESTLEKAAKHNGQLSHPSKLPKERAEVMNIYSKHGYPALDKYYSDSIGLKKYFYMLKFIMPKSVKRTIKKVISK